MKLKLYRMLFLMVVFSHFVSPILAEGFSPQSELGANVWAQPLINFSFETVDNEIQLAHTKSLKYEIRSVKAGRFPQLNLIGEHSFLQNTTGDHGSTMGRIEVPIFKKAQASLQVKNVVANYKIYEVIRISDKQRISLKLCQNYYEITALHNNRSRLLEELALLGNLIKNRQDLVNTKMLSQDDLGDLLRMQLDRKMTLEQTNERLKTMKTELSLIVNDASLLWTSTQTMINSNLPDPKTYADIAIDNEFTDHSDIILLSEEKNKRLIQSKLQSRETLPAINGFAGYSLDPRYDKNPNNLFVGFRAEWNLWDFSKNHNIVEMFREQVKELEARMVSEKNRLRLTVTEAFESYKSSLATLDLQNSYESLARDSYERASVKLQEGVISQEIPTLKHLEWYERQRIAEESKANALKKRAELVYFMGYPLSKDQQ